jgi:hypothetical protein
MWLSIGRVSRNTASNAKKHNDYSIVPRVSAVLRMDFSLRARGRLTKKTPYTIDMPDDASPSSAVPSSTRPASSKRGVPFTSSDVLFGYTQHNSA